MSSTGNSEVMQGIPVLEDAFVIIVKTEWNNKIVDELERGCRRVLKAHGVKMKSYTVPGAFEIPYAIKHLATGSKIPVDALIALGAVIKGDTPHFEYVSRGITDGIMQLNFLLKMPTIFGVLTVDNMEQAEERIGGAHGHKGEEAAATAIKMIALNREK